MKPPEAKMQTFDLAICNVCVCVCVCVESWEIVKVKGREEGK